ncbi:MAG: hypothetical protein QM786_04415 [Breznakibacter sp.]
MKNIFKKYFQCPEISKTLNKTTRITNAGNREHAGPAHLCETLPAHVARYTFCARYIPLQWVDGCKPPSLFPFSLRETDRNSACNQAKAMQIGH